MKCQAGTNTNMGREMSEYDCLSLFSAGGYMVIEFSLLLELFNSAIKKLF